MFPFGYYIPDLAREFSGHVRCFWTICEMEITLALEDPRDSELEVFEFHVRRALCPATGWFNNFPRVRPGSDPIWTCTYTFSDVVADSSQQLRSVCMDRSPPLYSLNQSDCDSFGVMGVLMMGRRVIGAAQALWRVSYETRHSTCPTADSSVYGLRDLRYHLADALQDDIREISNRRMALTNKPQPQSSRLLQCPADFLVSLAIQLEYHGPGHLTFAVACKGLYVTINNIRPCGSVSSLQKDASSGDWTERSHLDRLYMAAESCVARMECPENPTPAGSPGREWYPPKSWVTMRFAWIGRTP